MSSAARRWEFFETADGGVEPYQVNSPHRRRNPPLIVASAFANPWLKYKKGKKMAVINMRRNRKGQFVAGGGRKSNPKRKRKTHHRKNYMGAGALVPFVNPPRRSPARRHNPPSIAGIPIVTPEVGTVAAVLGGIVGPPALQTLGASLLSAGGTQQISPTVKTVIKVVSYALPPAAALYFSGRAAMKTVIAAEIASVLAVQVATMINSALTSASLSGYIGRPQQRMLSGYTGPTRQLSAGNWANRTGTPGPGNMNASRYRSRYHN